MRDNSMYIDPLVDPHAQNQKNCLESNTLLVG